MTDINRVPDQRGSSHCHRAVTAFLAHAGRAASPADPEATISATYGVTAPGVTAPGVTATPGLKTVKSDHKISFLARSTRTSMARKFVGQMPCAFENGG
ncbi:hypothetical protein, partial [Microbacterium lacticum]|uniref:hypothetical protein n=1 Tax=Microbacterium lacticum TaxID=33885 RepID=UPI001F5A5CBC